MPEENPTLSLVEGSPRFWEDAVTSRSLRRAIVQRDTLNDDITTYLHRAWATILDELGLRPDIQNPIDASRVELHGDRIALPVMVYAPKTQWTQERRTEHVIEMPISALDDPDESRQRYLLRKSRPLVCISCGLAHDVGSTGCAAPGCWGRVVWRSDAPPPAYYVEQNGWEGYYEPGSRMLRYAIDLQTQVLSGLQITHRRTDRWFIPSVEWQTDIVERIRQTVVPGIPYLLDGQSGGNAHASCLTFDEPPWDVRHGPTFKVLFGHYTRRLLQA